MGNIKTVTISAETAVKFDSFYPYVWIKNTGDTIAYASPFSGIVAGAENVVAVPAGESVMITAETDTVYILSTGTTAEVHGQGYAESPFLDNYSEGSSASITVESLSVTENGTYTAQTGKAYSPVTVNVHDYPYGDVLYENYNNSGYMDMTLSKAYTSYDEIIIECVSSGVIITQRYPTSQIEVNKSIGINCGISTQYIWWIVASTTSFTVRYQTSDIRVLRVIGIGGNNTMTETTLYTNSSSNTNPASFELSDDVRNYDEIVLVAQDGYDVGYLCEYYPTSILAQAQVLGVYTADTYVKYTLTDWENMTFSAANNFYIKKVIGITYGE